MNTTELEILNEIAGRPFRSQRELAERAGCSVGAANQALRGLQAEGLLTAEQALTERGRAFVADRSPRRAVILAAGFGMRMVPISREAPKALLEVRGETLIERQLRQLREVGVTEVSVVVGFMKERFEYLMDPWGVRLIVNPDYASGNNLLSLALAADSLDNCYIIPCDLWAADNPFRSTETGSWYMVADREDPESTVRINRRGELVFARGGEKRHAMIGIAYLTGAESARVRERLRALAPDPAWRESFWEETLREGSRMLLPARRVAADAVAEINTYEQLRELDGDSNHLKSETMDVLTRALDCAPEEITGITVLKKGMTNRSFLFACRGRRYIMRVPGEGTEKLIDRRREAAVYQAVLDTGLCDPVLKIDPESGYKLTAFVENARVCDADSMPDLRRCMALLRDFHARKLQVEHTFDIFGQIDFYEGLWEGAPSVFRDYAETKARVLALRPELESRCTRWALTHIDANPDNFLLWEENGQEKTLLIDWEYAGMQDQDVDLAMFCIYALYSREQTDRLIDLYYEEGCPEDVRYKIYGYMAACGLLWSNWCEFKRQRGVEFGEYALRQYRYAKEYERLARAYFESGRERA